MKKLVISVLIFLMVLMLSGCETAPKGNISELTDYSWQAKLDSGAEVSLDFDEDRARFYVKNGEKTVSISGRYLADETEFVIFMPEIKQNYGFGYTPRGSLLDIKHDGKTITMKKRSKNVA